MGLLEKVDFEYRYLNSETFYRQFWQLGASFRRSGFLVTFPVLDDLRLARYRRLLSKRVIGAPAQFIVLSFVSIYLRTEAV
jgi:hypothetical protein